MARDSKNAKDTKDPLKLRVPPQNIEVEQSLLGGLLVDPDSMNKVVDIIGKSDFYRDAHGKIFDLMVHLYEKNDAIDLITVSSLARDRGIIENIGGLTYLNTLVDLMPTAANIVYYAKMVREKALARTLINAATQIVEKGFDAETDIDTYLDEAEKLIFQVSENKLKPSFMPVRDFVHDSIKLIERLYEKKQAVTGVPTGFIDLDRLTSGLQPSDLIIVAGRPSMGKTSFSMNIAQYVSMLQENPVPVGIFSMEMSKEQLITRLLSSESEIEHSKLRTGTFSREEWPKLVKAAGKLTEARMFIDDSPALSVLEVRARARRLKKEHNVGLVVIDYLQLMRGRTGNDRREQEISEISRFLKALAKELNIPVIAISQLNRAPEAREKENKRPRLADLRESGAIEQDADVILFIYRDEVYNKDRDDNKGIAEVIIGKQRNGPTDTVRLSFIDKCTTFRNGYYADDER
ncbi:MAG: replicative DNA helicase [Syntrophorhabdus sp.]